MAYWLLLVVCWPLVAQQTEYPRDTSEPLRPLVPRTPRTEEEQDKLAAASFFAHGRLLLQRGERAQALRRFQRAWRFDPSAPAIMREILPLARRLRRNDEAARYAVLANELRPDDAQMLTQLGAQLVERRKLTQALELFAKALRLYEQGNHHLQALALRIEMGRLYFVDDQFEQAARFLSRSVELLEKPGGTDLTERQRQQLVRNPGLLHKLLAEASLASGRLDAAARSFRQAAALTSNPALLAFNLARVAFARGDFERARQQLDQYLDAKQSSAGKQAYELLDKLVSQEHDDPHQAREQLLKRLAALYEADRDNVLLGYHYADRLRGARKWADAERVYSDLLDSRPTADAYRGLTEIYYHRQQAGELLETLGKTLQEAGSLEVLSEQIAQLTADEPFLKRLLDLAAETGGDSPQSVTLVAALMAASGGQFEQAEVLYHLALEAAGLPRHEVMRRFGLAMFFADRPARAAEIFQAAIDRQPGDEFLPSYYFYLAGALETAHETDRALRAAEKAASLEQSIRFQTRPAWVCYHAKRYAEAERRYTQLVAQFDSQFESPAVRRAVRDMRLVLSSLCVSQGRLPDAEEWLAQVLDEFPEDVGALNDLGYLWADQGKHPQRALRMARRAVEAAPENAAYRDTLGWACYRTGHYEEAVRQLEKAIHSDKSDGVILDHLGDAYWKIGAKQKAIASWRRAVEALVDQADAKIRQATERKIKQHTG